MKKNNAEQYESIMIDLDPVRHPIAWENKIQSLMISGLTREHAEIEMIQNPTIELEMYYDVNCGLFMVESDAVESIPIFNPYTGEELEECDED